LRSMASIITVEIPHFPAMAALPRLALHTGDETWPNWK
jgi:hypothetical protein